MSVKHQNVAVAFVNGQAATGARLSSEVLPGGATLLRSYATPIAIRTKPRAVYLTTERHSTSTRRHAVACELACGRAVPFVGLERLDPEPFRALLRRHGVQDLGRAS